MFSTRLLNYLLPHEDSIRHGYRFEMKSYLLKFLRPLTWLLWGMLIIGMIDHFLLDPRGLAVLPEWLFDWLLILMWRKQRIHLPTRPPKQRTRSGGTLNASKVI